MPDVRVTPPATIPLSLIRPVKVRKATGLGGVLWSFHSNMPPTLLVDWEGSQYALYLSGSHPMRYFSVTHETSLSGAFVSGGEFLVDVSSRYDAAKKTDPLGALVLRGDQAFVIGTPVNDSFGDPRPVPLWGKYQGDGEDEAVGFTRWSLIVRDGDNVIELWRQESEATE